MEEELDEDTLHALALSMQEWEGDHEGAMPAESATGEQSRRSSLFQLAKE